MNTFDYLFERDRDIRKSCVENASGSITYEELYDHCLRLAQYINSQCGTGQNILLMAPNSVFFITAYLAILKSGNVAVPLSTETESENYQYIRDSCKFNLAFIHHRNADKYKEEGFEIIHELSLEQILNTQTRMVQTDTLFPSENLAEIIFTSGSTGKPKGVMISHRNLISNTESIVQYLKLTPDDTVLIVLPFYYCYGLSLLHTHLRVGGTVVLNNMFMMLGGILNDLKKYACTGFAGVPSHFQILLRKSDSFRKEHFPALKYVTQAGGKLYDSFIEDFITTFPHIRFNVMYGQTEATARLTWLPPEALPEKLGSCGKAIPGVNIRVVDQEGNSVKPGEIGEITAKGDNIMVGYYNDPEATAKTIKNGWLFTGDLAMVDEDGYIYLKARKNEIIKVGGRRISPKEIEEVIVRMPDVIDCSIEGVFDEILGETMKARVVVKNAGAEPITADKIKAWCSTHLARYKIPQIVEISHDMKISSTGKKIKSSR